jgi:uroporphyrinogen-III decarboxylase
MKRPKVYTSGDDPNQYLRNVEAYADHLEIKAKILIDALETLVENADDEALVAEDGWEVGNSPDSVQNFAQRALDNYRKD